jgi:hypothetical protein
MDLVVLPQLLPSAGLLPEGDAEVGLVAVPGSAPPPCRAGST